MADPYISFVCNRTCCMYAYIFIEANFLGLVTGEYYVITCKDKRANPAQYLIKFI